MTDTTAAQSPPPPVVSDAQPQEVARNVYVIPATLPPGQHEIYVQGTGPKGGPSRSGTLNANIAPGGDNVYYFRMP